ncbi:MAG: VWA domain-containing protein [Deltaproteobacteria bacterium]|nr:VWA domain-containing protein [Deltaproteobacteria bacterium]
MRVLRTVGPGWRARLLPLSVGLRATAVALLVVALARPQDSSRREETELEGIDIVLTVDVSFSMKAEDLEPTRLEAAKEVVLDFIKRRKNDRIGAVIFAENAYTLCPLTLDYSILASMIGEIDLGVVDGNATAIGNAVGVAINRLRRSDAKSKVVILLTDGTSNAGNISPEQAAQFAETLGIKIYTVLMGQQDDAQVTTGIDFFKQQIFGSASMPINRELLVQLSEQTGGAFFEATDRKALVSSFHSILDALERSRIADQGVVYAEVFWRYLWPGLALVIADLLLVLFGLRRSP